MNGRLVFIHPETLIGLINGVDNRRYQFNVSSWLGHAILHRNEAVSFEIENGWAINVRPRGADAPILHEQVAAVPLTPAKDDLLEREGMGYDHIPRREPSFDARLDQDEHDDLQAALYEEEFAVPHESIALGKKPGFLARLFGQKAKG